MHHNRHREILRIIRQINANDQESMTLTPSRIDEGCKSRRGSTVTSGTTTTDTSSESKGLDEPKATRRERKKARKTGNGVVKDRRNIEAFPKEETDFVSEAIHLSIHESKGAWEGTYVYGHKQPEAEETALTEGEGDGDDIKFVIENASSLSFKQPSLMTPRQRRVFKKFNAPNGHQIFRGGSRKYSPSGSASSSADPYEGVDPDILFRLGVEVINPLKNSKSRKDLITKLLAAVKEDVDIIEREEQETAMREEGFWRWAGRGAYYSILQIREELDWATGQKKGAPRQESFADDEMDLERLRECLPGRPEAAVSTFRKIVVQEDVLPREAEEEDGWEKVNTKNLRPKSLKKVYKKLDLFRKRTTVTTRSEVESDIFDFKEEESAEVDEMVKRYSQRLAGQRDIGRFIESLSPTKQRFTVRVK
jgi:hypothetical protein